MNAQAKQEAEGAQRAASPEAPPAPSLPYLGNNMPFYRLAGSPVGKTSRIVDDPQQLWDLVFSYFEWVYENPLHEVKAMKGAETIEYVTLPKLRAMTIEGLCAYLGISRDTWHKWGKEGHELTDVVSHANNIIREQKFTGAASDLLNANIIARDLGLAEKNEHSGPNGAPMEMSYRERLADRLAKIRGRKDTA